MRKAACIMEKLLASMQVTSPNVRTRCPAVDFGG